MLRARRHTAVSGLRYPTSMDLRFADPWILTLLIALPFVALAAVLFRGSRGAVAVGSIEPAGPARRTWRVRIEPWVLSLRMLAVAALIVAVARPQRSEAAPEAQGEGIDIVLAYDVSSSMSEPFVGGRAKLAAAQDVLTRFVLGRTNDRVGLVVFSGNSLTLSPLTTDYAALADAVEIAHTLRLKEQTAIGTALGESVNVLRESRSTSRIVILMTDGQSNAGTVKPLEAARIAERLGVRVYTVGVVARSLGRSTSTLIVDETALKEIADVTGGTYNRAEDPAALQRIYDDIDRLEKSRFEAVEATRYVELASWALALAALALAVELLLRATAFRRLA